MTKHPPRQFRQFRFAAMAVIMMVIGLHGCESPQQADDQPTLPTPSIPGDAGPNSARPQQADPELNYGYSALLKLTEKNSAVDKILWLKRVSERTKPLVQESASLCSQVANELPELLDQPPIVSVKETGLPEVETLTRIAIENERRGTLLGSSGEVLERELLLSQIDAIRYAQQLSQQLAEKDANDARADYLERKSNQFASLGKRLAARLTPAD